MFTVRTDLAVEAHKMYAQNTRQDTELKGIKAETKREGNICVTTVEILDEHGEKAIGKPVGRYITIESPNIKFDTEDYEKTCGLIRDTIKKLVELDKNSVTLVVGLGNKNITPDALGTDVVERLMVTHHIKKHMPQLLEQNIKSVCAIAPGVLGTTGMETSDIIQGVSTKLKPDLIIVIDALAAADYNRIGTTFQICDTGIQPGAGVGNNREKINEASMGAKVIAIGVPTVVDARAISKEADEQEGTDPLMVTPKDIDLVIERAAKTVANGINMALHDNITLKEVEEFVG